MIISVLSKVARSYVGIAIFVGLSFVMGLLYSPRISAAHEAGRIISDSAFLDSKSMSINDIQSFLSSKGSGLKDMSFTLSCYSSNSQERQWYTAAGATCDTNIPASQIIYYAAQIYGVSPKVILATMQKEQSLATATNPTTWQLTQAMGYACPTSGSCSTASSFSYQIDSGTWALRYHYERARGNMSWWYTSTSWVCGSAKSLYSPSLYPERDVKFYDTDGVHYATVYIQNAATSSLYCYTPHTYNNPSGLYGRPAYGTTGRYYSGSYNFVYFYELWFGSTSGQSFSATYRRQSQYQIINTGSTVEMYFDFENTGTAFWKDQSSAFPGYPPVKLATTNTINRVSNFASSSWPASNRPTVEFNKVFEKDGITLAPDQHTVLPGQIARFAFDVTATNVVGPGVHREFFQPILEGSPGWAMGNWVYQDIGVSYPNYKASYHSQSGYPSINRGSTGYAFFRMKNTGNEPWYDQLTTWPAKNPIRLATTSPINRNSRFESGWPFASRPVVRFYKVLEADGITLASNQHVVGVGQIAEFVFNLSVPNGTSPGVYREEFEVIAEGAPGFSWSIGPTLWMQITVP